MIRTASAATAIALSLALAACGGGADESATATPAATETTEAAPAATESEAMPSETAAAAEPAAETGKAPIAFTQCKACHSVEPGKNLIGPSLAGIYGTKAGQDVPDYVFSTAMKNSGLTWDDATLNKYLESPQAVVPGTKMSFAGIKDAAKRQEVIDYLKTL